jgi:hypothetical protein
VAFQSRDGYISDAAAEFRERNNLDGRGSDLPEQDTYVRQ